MKKIVSGRNFTSFQRSHFGFSGYVTCVCLNLLRWLTFILSCLYVLEKSLYAVWYKCETSTSQPSISQYCRPCTFYFFLDREMLRWYLTAFKLTAFNQSLADQDLRRPLPIRSARYRVNFNKINSLQTSCFSILHFNIYSL